MKKLMLFLAFVLASGLAYAKTYEVLAVDSETTNSMNLKVEFTGDKGETVTDTVAVYAPPTLDYVKSALANKGNQVLKKEDVKKEVASDLVGQKISF